MMVPKRLVNGKYLNENDAGIKIGCVEIQCVLEASLTYTVFYLQLSAIACNPKNILDDGDSAWL